MIKDFAAGNQINNESFLITGATLCTSTSGKKYFNVRIQDKTGSCEAKKWIVEDGDGSILKRGNIVKICGVIKLFNKFMQVDIQDVESSDLENIDDFIASSPLSDEYIRSEVDRLICSIENEDVKKIVSAIYAKHEDTIYIYPAAVSNHHDYIRGLLTHSITIAHLCENVVEEYKKTNIYLDRDVLIGGALLHDIGKIVEFTSPILPEYSMQGNLLGHISIGSAEVKEVCDELGIESEKGILLQHMILSHHGQYDYGSPVLPMTKEAMVLSLIDNLDARVVMTDKIENSLVDEGTFSERIIGLDGRRIYKTKKE